MKFFKALAVAALLVSGTVAMAQAPQGGGGRMQRSNAETAKAAVDRLIEPIGLTAEQQAKVSAVALKFAVKDSVSMAGMRAQGESADREAFMAERTKSREAQTAEIKAILTDAQKPKYDAFLEANPARGFGGMGGGAPRN